MNDRSMPLIRESSYRPPVFFTNSHVQTIYPALFRKVAGVRYHRERIGTPDNDFLDLDWSAANREKLAIVCHGLEGDSCRPYMLGMVRALNSRGWDALAWNYRGCSGEPNRQARFYNSGETGDLDTVIKHALAASHYTALALVGFSAGGNIVLRYLGERGDMLPGVLKAAVTFSVPCDLASSALRLAEPANRIYMKRFLRLLRAKIRKKMEVMPGVLDDSGFDRIKNFQEFDDLYTAPAFGFTDAEDYWKRSSSRKVLAGIRLPVLLVNALDDPFLAPSCYPVEEAQDCGFLHLETPRYGGHVGFVSLDRNGEYWSEARALSFLDRWVA